MLNGRKYLPQRTNTTGFQNKRRLCQRLPDPAHCKGSQYMTVSNDEDVLVWILGRVVDAGVVFRPDIGD